jgi:hypothetical protein
MTGKTIGTVVAALAGAAIWFITATLLREESSVLPALNFIGFASMVTSYFLGKRWGTMWMFAFPVAMLAAAMYFNAARYDYTPRARALPSQVQPKTR